MNRTAGCQLRKRPAYIMPTALSSQRNSDYALARAAANGLTAGIGDLYERHSGQVYSVCLRMTGNRAEAEDLTQEVFIHLLGKIGSFRGESKFTSWLYRLTVNKVLMHLRRASRRDERRPSEFEMAIRRVGKHSTVVDRIALDTALAQLPSGCRAVFLMFDVQGYNHEEIASIFGCSVGTSKSQLHKARKKLRRLLSETAKAKAVSNKANELTCLKNGSGRSHSKEALVASL